MGTPQGRFERLYRAHTNAVMLYVLRRTSPADAADVHSEVFLVAWRRLDEVPEEAVLPWLYGVARRVLANQRRGQRRQSDLADHLRAHAPQPVTPDASTVDDLPLLAAMETLSEQDREVLRLVAWEDLAPREAARVLGCRPATCPRALARGASGGADTPASRGLAGGARRPSPRARGRGRRSRDLRGQPAAALQGQAARRRVSSSIRVLGLRVADPAGGAPWGLRIYRTARGDCLEIGRIRKGGFDRAYDVVGCSGPNPGAPPPSPGSYYGGTMEGTISVDGSRSDHTRRAGRPGAGSGVRTVAYGTPKGPDSAYLVVLAGDVPSHQLRAISPCQRQGGRLVAAVAGRCPR